MADEREARHQGGRKSITITDKIGIGKLKLKGTRDLNFYQPDQINRHITWVATLNFSPNGKFLVTAGGDRSLVVVPIVPLNYGMLRLAN